MKGISEILSLTIVVLISLTIFSGFYYWYDNLNEDSKIITEDYTQEVQNQVITRTNKVIDDMYAVSKEKNINNFAELTLTVEADDAPIDVSCEDSSVQIYEGYGSNTELICSHYDLNCNCETTQRYIYGVLERHSSSPQGLALLASTDFSSFTEKNIVITGDPSSTLRGFDITYLDTFVEGGNSCNEPENLLLLGYGSDPGEGYGQISIILDENLEGSYYDKFNDVGVSEGQIAKYYDNIFVNDILEESYDGGRSYDTMTWKYHVFAGAITNLAGDQFLKQTMGFGKQIWRSSIGVGLYDALGVFGAIYPSTQSDLAVSNIENVYFNSHPAILMGTKDEQTDYTVGGVAGTYPTNVFDAYLAISKTPASIPLIQGQFSNYIDPTAYPDEAFPNCPYDRTNFRDVCNYDESIIAACDVKFNSVETMLTLENFDNPISSGSGTVVMGINNFKSGTLRNDFNLIYTNYNDSSGQNQIYCLDTYYRDDHIPLIPGGNIWAYDLDLAASNPVSHYEVIDMKSYEGQAGNKVFTLVKDRGGDEFPWLIIFDDGNWDAQPVYIELNHVDAQFRGSSAAGNYKIDSLAVRIFDEKVYVYLGGKENDGSGGTKAIMYELILDNTAMYSVIGGSKIYESNDYASVNKLLIMDKCIKKEPFFENGCGETISRKERLDMILNIEDTDCDLSSYNAETIFTSEINIGKNRFYEIFKKESDPSLETDVIQV